MRHWKAWGEAMIRTNNFQIFYDGSIRFTLPSRPNIKEINKSLVELNTSYKLEYRKQEQTIYLCCLKTDKYIKLKNYTINYFYK